MTKIPDIHDKKLFPDMTRWFDPVLLVKLLFNVVVSGVFGQYADRRLIVAALDTVPDEKLIERATDVQQKLVPDQEGAVWLDFVADLGDGFDSTYAVASLLGQHGLQIEGEMLPRGQLLYMGGDEVYPVASSDAYRFQLGRPYSFAFPDHDRSSESGVPLFAVPGNHDWYDGLVMFLMFFCRDRAWHVGSWRSQQSRSYFAIKLTDTWWLWAMDIQLADNMDQPQADYFKLIAGNMDRGSKIILCSAEPGWLYTHTKRRSWEIMDYALSIVHKADRELTVPLLLSGDTHHYSRYSAEDGVQFVTSGGGGAFLHPTHQLRDRIDLKWLGTSKRLSLMTDPGAGHGPSSLPACYPTRERSKQLLSGNLLFAFQNWDFALAMGAIYWVFGVALALRPYLDMYAITLGIFAWALMGYARRQEKSDHPKVYAASFVHALAHACAVILLFRYFDSYNAAHFTFVGAWYEVWKWLGILLVEMGICGAIVGGTIFGLNLLITCRWLDMNHNDAFSALRLEHYRNFLRIRIKGDELTIYPVGLDNVPRRNAWQFNPKSGPGIPDEPVFVPSTPLAPHLIERPIVIRPAAKR